MADRNRHVPDHTSAGYYRHQARFGHAAVSRNRGGGAGRKGPEGGAGRRRLSGAHQALARHVPHHLWRPGPLREAILVALSGQVSHWRRRQGGRGRILLAAGPSGRRDERGWPSHFHLRSRECAGGSSRRWPKPR